MRDVISRARGFPGIAQIRALAMPAHGGIQENGGGIVNSRVAVAPDLFIVTRMRKTMWVAAGVMLASSASAQSYSVWLPESKELVVTPAYAFKTFDKYWAGREEVDSAERITQHGALFSAEYGVNDKLALDFTGGYTWHDTIGETDDGLADTRFGARYRWLDEETIALSFVPSIGLRVGGIIEGTYDERLPFVEGNGASGAEASLLMGKAVTPNFGWFGDVGYRYLNHDVPDELVAGTGVYGAYKFVTAHLGYRHVQSLSGSDLGDAPFPKLKEINQTLEVGVGFSDQGRRYYQIFYGHTLAGRNTGQKDIFGAAVSFSF